MSSPALYLAATFWTLCAYWCHYQGDAEALKWASGLMIAHWVIIGGLFVLTLFGVVHFEPRK